jgi:hypothetical protein
VVVAQRSGVGGSWSGSTTREGHVRSGADGGGVVLVDSGEDVECAAGGAMIAAASWGAWIVPGEHITERDEST